MRSILPKVTLDVMMPPSATSLAVPPGFLQPGTEYEWEVLASEEGGDQTLSSSFFTTSSSRAGDGLDTKEPSMREDSP
jgi:hypothetical protein